MLYSTAFLLYRLKKFLIIFYNLIGGNIFEDLHLTQYFSTPIETPSAALQHASSAKLNKATKTSLEPRTAEKLYSTHSYGNKSKRGF